MIRSITVEDVLAREPCYPEDRIRELSKGLGARATAKQLYRHLYGKIPDRDLLWLLLTRPLMTKRNLRLFACDCASRALRREGRAGRIPDKRSYAAVQVARRFADGKAMVDELKTSSAAAYVASSAAYAASSPAAYFASAAAFAAAASSPAAAATYAATHAADATERQWQAKRLEQYLSMTVDEIDREAQSRLERYFERHGISNPAEEFSPAELKLMLQAERLALIDEERRRECGGW